METLQKGLDEVKLVCGWCGIVLRDGPEDRVSHGICKNCRVKVEAADRL